MISVPATTDVVEADLVIARSAARSTVVAVVTVLSVLSISSVTERTTATLFNVEGAAALALMPMRTTVVEPTPKSPN